jgi:hypothetical protein
MLLSAFIGVHPWFTIAFVLLCLDGRIIIRPYGRLSSVFLPRADRTGAELGGVTVIVTVSESWAVLSWTVNVTV